MGVHISSRDLCSNNNLHLCAVMDVGFDEEYSYSDIFMAYLEKQALSQ
jgi:hypothetical protein